MFRRSSLANDLEFGSRRLMKSRVLSRCSRCSNLESLTSRTRTHLARGALVAKQPGRSRFRLISIALDTPDERILGDEKRPRGEPVVHFTADIAVDTESGRGVYGPLKSSNTPNSSPLHRPLSFPLSLSRSLLPRIAVVQQRPY